MSHALPPTGMVQLEALIVPVGAGGVQENEPVPTVSHLPLESNVTGSPACTHALYETRGVTDTVIDVPA